MTTSFTVLAAALPRLAALRHAIDTMPNSSLSHIQLYIDGDTARFRATSGRMLAVLALNANDVDGAATTVVIDGPRFTAACATLLKGDHATVLRLVIDQAAREVRLIRGTALAVVRLVDTSFPAVDAILDHYRNGDLLPSIASIAPALLTIAQRVVGTKAPMLFWSACANGRLACCWSRDEVEISLSSLLIREQLAQPSIWADHELLILIMPVTRVASGAPELNRFLAQAPAISRESSMRMIDPAPAAA